MGMTYKHKATIGEKVGRLGVQFDRLRKEFNEFVEHVEMKSHEDETKSSLAKPKIPAEAYLPKTLGYIQQEGIESLKLIQPIRLYPVHGQTGMVPVCLLTAAQDAINEALAGEHPVAPPPEPERKGIFIKDAKDKKLHFLPENPEEWPWVKRSEPPKIAATIGPVQIVLIQSAKGRSCSYRIKIPMQGTLRCRWLIRGKKPSLRSAQIASVQTVIEQLRGVHQEEECPLPAMQEHWKWYPETQHTAIVNGWKICIMRFDRKWMCAVYTGDKSPMKCVLQEDLPETISDAEIKQIMVDKARTLWFERAVGR